MWKFIDQIGHSISFENIPARIVSLVPSQTEFLCEIGLSDSIVGVTKFCVHPKETRKEKAVVGGTKKLKIGVIRDLKPDLVIANREENDKAQITELQKEFNVWTSDIRSVSDADDMMRSIGNIFRKEKETEKLLEEIHRSLALVKGILAEKTCLYFIWNKPRMVAGGDTFISAMLEYAGLKNLANDLERYPELTDEQIQNMNPDFVLLSSEPFPFSEKHISEFKTFLPNSKIFLVDGEAYSWYGPRMRNF